MDIIVVASTRATAQPLVDALQQEHDALELPVTIHLVTPGDELPDGPALHVLFPHDGAPWDELAARMDDAASSMLSVVKTAPDAMSIRAPLNRLNAFIRSTYGTDWIEALCEEILSQLWLPRRTRRVFISYRRIDSQPIATQLFDAFNQLGFQVFLDTASIDVSRDFQHELWWWLIDADLVVQLASPRLVQSDWIRQETEFAKGASIGMLHVRWPSACFGKGVPRPEKHANDEDTLLDLDLADLKSGPEKTSKALLEDADDPSTAFDKKKEPRHYLPKDRVDAIVARALTLRVRAIQERRWDLVERMRQKCTEAGAVVTQSGVGDLLVDYADSGRTLVRVAPCRPDPTMVVDAMNATDGDASVQEGRLTYMEYDPDD